MQILVENMFLKKSIEQKRKLEKKEGKKYYTKKLKKINKTKSQNKNCLPFPQYAFHNIYH